jgi:mono/diheme cytochrome c family protein
MGRFIPLVLVIVMLVVAGCSPASVNEEPLRFEDLPTGDAVRGEQLFSQSINRAPTCSSCHMVEGAGNAATPSLAGYGAIAGERVAGQSAEEYSFWSIVDVGRYVVPRYANVMYHDYGNRMTPQDIADVIAYMLEL